MAGKTKYIVDDMRRLIRDGLTKQQIISEMGIKSTVQADRVFFNLMIDDGKFCKVKGGWGTGGKILGKKKKVFKVGKNGNITLSKIYLSLGGFQPGDTFLSMIRRKKVILTKVEETDKEVQRLLLIQKNEN